MKLPIKSKMLKDPSKKKLNGTISLIWSHWLASSSLTVKHNSLEHTGLTVKCSTRLYNLARGKYTKADESVLSIDI